MKSTHAPLQRFWLGCLCLVTLAALTACAASAPPQLLHLRTQLPDATGRNAPSATASATKAATTSSTTSSTNWQLVTPVRLPDYLDRDALLVPQGQAGLQTIPGYRWAEPLRESVPRVLRQDLAMLLGEDRVWTSPVPDSVVIDQQLRIELLAFESNAERTAVVLQARWIVSKKGSASLGRSHSATLTVPSKGADADSLVAAHRQALWLFAQRIVAP